MGKGKESRWYEIEAGVAFVYDAPHPAQATGCSVVSASDLDYYRRNFHLEKCWPQAE